MRSVRADAADCGRVFLADRQPGLAQEGAEQTQGKAGFQVTAAHRDRVGPEAGRAREPRRAGPGWRWASGPGRKALC